MTKIDHTQLKATPENENFKGKYENTGFIAKKLVDGYFKAVKQLVDNIPEATTAHEVGVGEGHSTKRLKKMVSNLSGSEYVGSLLPIAQQNNPEVAIFQESVYELSFHNNQVDLVFLLEVLEHLDYPVKALNEIQRISKNYLIIGVPNEPLWRILNMCRLKYLKDLGNTPGHLNHYSEKSLIKIVEQHFGKVLAIKKPLPWIILLAQKNEQL